MFFPRLLAGSVLSASVFLAHAKPCSDDLTVAVSGGIVHGKVDPATPDVRQFLGIPFAQPPVGDLRFAPPQPLSEDFSEIDAKELPPGCMQFLSSTASIYTREVFEFNLGGKNETGPVSEDCLLAAVWAPRAATIKQARGEKLPVLLYIHGGGFVTGGINGPYRIPAEMVQRSQSHIVVVFNYRVNIFGFPNAAGLDGNQNLGLLDQRRAVEWTRDNVAAFGGDPDRIGLWGQSAGAISVGYYSYAYAEDPIVSSLYMNSGTELLAITTPDESQSNFTYVASSLGCGGGLDPAAELACVRGLDAAKIEGFLQEYAESGSSPELTFAPVVDEQVVFSNYTALALAGKVARVPTVIGTTRQDGTVTTPWGPPPEGSDAELVEQNTLRGFYCPGLAASQNRVDSGVVPVVYRYLYAGNFSNVSPRVWMASYHSSDLPQLFGTHPLYRGNSTELEYQTSHAMQDRWIALVTAGEEGLGQVEGPAWVAFDGAAESEAMEFGSGVPAKMIDTAELDALCAA